MIFHATQRLPLPCSQPQDQSCGPCDLMRSSLRQTLARRSVWPSPTTTPDNFLSRRNSLFYLTHQLYD